MAWIKLKIDDSEKQSVYAAMFNFWVFALVYVVAAEWGHSLSFPCDFASFWPPSGLYVAVLLSSRSKGWPALMVAGVVGNLSTDVLFHGKSLVVSLGFSLGNTCEAFTGAWLVLRFCGRPFHFSSLRSILTFLGCSVLLSTALGATLGAAIVVGAFGGMYWQVWAVWWSGDVVGVLIVSPLVLVAMTEVKPWCRQMQSSGLAEGLALLIGLGITAEYIFGYQTYPLVWMTTPFLLWAALRFEIMGVVSAVGVLAVLTVWNTSRGRGPLTTFGTVAVDILMVQLYVFTLAASFLVVGAVVKERREFMRTTQQEKKRWRELFDHMEEHVFSMDVKGNILQVNRACREALGYTEQEMLALNVMQLVHPDELAVCRHTLEQQLIGEKVRIVGGRVVTKSGKTIYVEGSTEIHFVDGLPMYSLSIFQNVTDRLLRERQLDEYRHALEEANAQLAKLATTDELTGLKNRRSIQDELAKEVQRSLRQSTPLSLLLLDVDHFKQFNDAFGHPAGDRVLRGVARILEETARVTDFVARFGGEEFAVILPDTDQRGALLLAERFRKNIADEEWREREITVSIGVATMSDTDGNDALLIEAADDALYRSKKKGRNCVHHADAPTVAVK